MREGAARCRAVLAGTGLLLVQDARLPSVTTIVTGAPVRGSWWSHEQAHSIFDVLEALEPDTTTAKLLLRKQTLVDRRLHRELAAVGGAHADWQVDGLCDDARDLLAAVADAGGEVRTDALPSTGTRPRAEVVRDLECRLLVASHEIHTESGRHAKVLQPWVAWAEREHLGPLPDPLAARSTFEGSLRRALVDAGLRRSPFPWPSEDPS